MKVGVVVSIIIIIIIIKSACRVFSENLIRDLSETGPLLLLLLLLLQLRLQLHSPLSSPCYAMFCYAIIWPVHRVPPPSLVRSTSNAIETVRWLATCPLPERAPRNPMSHTLGAHLVVDNADPAHSGHWAMR